MRVIMKERIIFSVIAAGLMFFITTCDTVENVIDKPSIKGKVVYVTYHDTSKLKELTVMNIDGTNKRVIDTCEPLEMLEPDWSKDGKKIIYVMQAAVNGGLLGVINEDGSGKKPIKRKVGNGFDEIRNGSTPRFSPNGEFFVYESNGTSGTTPALFSFSDSTTKILYDPYYSYEFGHNPWTKESKKVLASAQLKRNGERGIHLIDIYSGEIESLISNPQNYFMRPLFSQDEEEIIYSTKIYGSSNIGSLYHLNVKTKVITKLTFSINNLKIMFPKYWTKDKRFLLFTADYEDGKQYTSDLLYHDFLTGKTDYLLKNVSYDIDVWLEE